MKPQSDKMGRVVIPQITRDLLAKAVRSVVIGPNAGLFVCRTHFIKETLTWSDRPAWDELPLQYADETETEAHDPDDHECEYLGSGMWSCGHCDQS